MSQRELPLIPSKHALKVPSRLSLSTSAPARTGNLWGTSFEQLSFEGTTSIPSERNPSKSIKDEAERHRKYSTRNKIMSGLERGVARGKSIIRGARNWEGCGASDHIPSNPNTYSILLMRPETEVIKYGFTPFYLPQIPRTSLHIAYDQAISSTLATFEPNQVVDIDSAAEALLEEVVWAFLDSCEGYPRDEENFSAEQWSGDSSDEEAVSTPMERSSIGSKSVWSQSDLARLEKATAPAEKYRNWIIDDAPVNLTDSPPSSPVQSFFTPPTSPAEANFGHIYTSSKVDLPTSPPPPYPLPCLPTRIPSFPPAKELHRIILKQAVVSEDPTRRNRFVLRAALRNT